MAGQSLGTSNSSAITCSTASAVWAKACRSRLHPTVAAFSGSRMRARQRISPRSTYPIRASQRSWHRRICRSLTCARIRWRPAEISWRWPTKPKRKACNPPAWSCSTFPCRKSRGRSHSSTAQARPRAGCISSGSATASTFTARLAHPISRPRIPTMISSIAVLTSAIRQSRSRWGAGGCRARGRATTSRRRHVIRWTRGTAPTTPTSIPSAATVATSPISMAACSSWIFRIRRTRNGSRSGPTRLPTPDSCIP